MTNYEYLNKNLKAIREEFRRGFISYSLMNRYWIYCRYDYHRKAGSKKPDAVLHTSCDMNISEQYVYNIIKQMESE